jgi:hypothetical protein
MISDLSCGTAPHRPPSPPSPGPRQGPKALVPRQQSATVEPDSHQSAPLHTMPPAGLWLVNDRASAALSHSLGPAGRPQRRHRPLFIYCLCTEIVVADGAATTVVQEDFMRSLFVGVGRPCLLERGMGLMMWMIGCGHSREPVSWAAGSTSSSCPPQIKPIRGRTRHRTRVGAR